MRPFTRRTLPQPPRAPELPVDVLEELPDAVIVCDTTGAVVMMNRKAREGLGGSTHRRGPDEIPAEHWSEYYGVYPRDGSKAVPTEALPLVRALGGEEVRDEDLRIRDQDGRMRIANISGSPLHDSDGQLTGAVIVMHDITDRIALEDRLRFQSAVVANLGPGVSLVRASDGDIVYTNERWDRMFGYDTGELLGRHISVVNAAADQTPEARAQEIFDALDRDGVWSGEVHNVRKDGEEFWTSCSVSRFDHHEHGSVWISVNSDITRRRASDERLRETERTYRRLFDSSPAALAMIDAELRLTLVNQAFCDIVGYSRDELQGMPLPNLTHPDDVAVCTEVRAKVRSGETPRYRVEERLLTRQGDVVPVALTATVVRGPDGAPVAEIAAIERLRGQEQ
jgi:PAS domain S-box-containing protein